MKRVLYLLDNLYSDAGGGTEKQFLILYNKCMHTGVRPFVAFLMDADIHHRLDWFNPPLILNVKRIISLNSILSLYKLLRYVRDNRIEIIHTMYDDSAILVSIISFFAKNVKIIISLRNMGYEHNGMRMKIMSAIYHRSDIMTVNSNAIKNLLVKNYGIRAHKIHVIYNFIFQGAGVNENDNNGINGGMFEKIRQEHDYVALVISNLRDIKGIEYIIMALRILVEKYDLAVVIIGEGEQRNRYQALIDELNLGGNLFMLGYKHNTAYYIKQSDICVLTSLSEGFSNALIEYAINSKPIIATNVGGNPEILDNGNAGILVEPKNADILAEKMKLLMDSKDLRKELAAKIKTHIEQLLDEKIIIQKYKVIYS